LTKTKKELNDRLANDEKLIKQTKSDNLELEIKLESATEERNQLVDRCVNAERMQEHLKIQNIELKRKLEDTQYGLQELGREHQILQVGISSASTFHFAKCSAVL
jgi:hypothetical protein